MSSPSRWTIASDSCTRPRQDKPGFCPSGPGGWPLALHFATMLVFSPPSAPGCRRAPHLFQIQANAMLETNPINHLIKDLSERTDVLRGYL